MPGQTYRVAEVFPMHNRWVVYRFNRDGTRAHASEHRTERGALQAVNNWSKFLANTLDQ